MFLETHSELFAPHLGLCQDLAAEPRRAWCLLNVGRNLLFSTDMDQ